MFVLVHVCVPALCMAVHASVQVAVNDLTFFFLGSLINCDLQVVKQS